MRESCKKWKVGELEGVSRVEGADEKGSAKRELDRPRARSEQGAAATRDREGGGLTARGEWGSSREEQEVAAGNREGGNWPRRTEAGESEPRGRTKKEPMHTPHTRDKMEEQERGEDPSSKTLTREATTTHSREEMHA